jgi:hypothetical protein
MSHGTALSLTLNIREIIVVRSRLNATRMLVASVLESLWQAEWNYLLNREWSLKSFAETETTKMQFSVWTTIIFQIFGVNESAVPCDIQNCFKY